MPIVSEFGRFFDSGVGEIEGAVDRNAVRLDNGEFEAARVNCAVGKMRSSSGGTLSERRRLNCSKNSRRLGERSFISSSSSTAFRISGVIAPSS